MEVFRDGRVDLLVVSSGLRQPDMDVVEYDETPAVDVRGGLCLHV